MTRKTVIILAALLALSLAFVAAGEASGIPKSIFDNAKTALRYMSEGDYTQAIKLLGMENRISSSELKQTIDTNCRELYNIQVQADYSVAWKNQNGLFLAVPVSEPADGFVDTDYSFGGLRFVKWIDVDRQLASAGDSVWHEKYSPSYRIFED